MSPPCGEPILWGISPDFSGLSPCYRWIAYVLLTRAPVADRGIATSPLPLDLHVLGLPLAFILSQDQTLRCCQIVCLVSFAWPCSCFRTLALNCCSASRRAALFYSLVPSRQRTFGLFIPPPGAALCIVVAPLGAPSSVSVLLCNPRHSFESGLQR